jgi:hypothetical protein
MRRPSLAMLNYALNLARVLWQFRNLREASVAQMPPANVGGAQVN